MQETRNTQTNKQTNKQNVNKPRLANNTVAILFVCLSVTLRYCIETA